ncbi:MAG: hypothetical protein VX640_00250 [Pseudomonadota bacterium]|nr:hypothetical protein [Pseudomonadota bacterium]
MAASGFGLGAAALVLLGSSAMAAQDAQQPSPEPAGEQTAAPEQAAPAEPNPDEMAAELNARQQIKQTFTITRTINGEVVETDKRTVTYSRDDPARPSEAGASVVEQLISAFNNEVLTRAEAFEEAKLDFVIADVDRDEFMSRDEFIGLVENWRRNAARKAEPDDEETARERQYRAFIEELNPQAAAQNSAEQASRKFAFMAGASPVISREDYIREYLLDFDSMDADGDSILRGEQLVMFRALNRGERLEPRASAEAPATPPQP